jgi:hypothetical protein
MAEASENEGVKVCPFCKEEIKVDAIKCRHCQSYLLPVQPGNPVVSNTPAETSESGKGNITYVLDKDLIRFAKFAFFVLGIFTLVGVYLYGIDLKELAKDQEGTKDRLQALKAQLDSQRDSLITEGKDLNRQRSLLQQANDTFIGAENRFQTSHTREVDLINTTRNEIAREAGLAKEYAARSKYIYDTLKTYPRRAARLMDELTVNINLRATQLKIPTGKTAYSFILGAQVTGSDHIAAGRVGLIVENADHEVFAICAGPFLPPSDYSRRKVKNQNNESAYIIAGRDTLVEIGRAYRQSRLDSYLGLVRLEHADGKNMLVSGQAVKGIRGITSQDIERHTQVFLYKNGKSPSAGIVVANPITTDYSVPDGNLPFKSLIATTIDAEAGLSGSLLVDQNDYALGIMVGRNDKVSFFIPLTYLLQEFKVSMSPLQE